jgi:hypothetical protein
MMSISHSIQFLNEEGKWAHWYYAHDEDHAREVVRDFVPTKGAPHPIRAVKHIESQEVLCTSSQVTLPPQPGVDYSKHSS